MSPERAAFVANCRECDIIKANRQFGRFIWEFKIKLPRESNKINFQGQISHVQFNTGVMHRQLFCDVFDKKIQGRLCFIYNVRGRSKRGGKGSAAKSTELRKDALRAVIKNIPDVKYKRKLSNCSI